MSFSLSLYIYDIDFCLSLSISISLLSLSTLYSLLPILYSLFSTLYSLLSLSISLSRPLSLSHTLPLSLSQPISLHLLASTKQSVSPCPTHCLSYLSPCFSLFLCRSLIHSHSPTLTHTHSHSRSIYLVQEKFWTNFQPPKNLDKSILGLSRTKSGQEILDTNSGHSILGLIFFYLGRGVQNFFLDTPPQNPSKPPGLARICPEPPPFFGGFGMGFGDGCGEVWGPKTGEN